MSDKLQVQATDQTLMHDAEAGIMSVIQATIAENTSELNLPANLDTSV